MMKLLAWAAATISCLMMFAPGAGAAELGMVAPPLEIAKWVKGEPVALAELKGKAVVVEFWATWCPPCRQSIPHLTKLQQKYGKELVIIGVTSEDPATVAPFVEKLGAKMEYHVAVDAADKTAMGYMGAFKEDGIPHAFIVDKEGKLVWHDYPLSPVFEEALAKVVAGDFDPVAFTKIKEEQDRKQQEGLKLANEYLGRLDKGEETEEVKQLGQKVLETFKDDAMILSQMSMIIANGDFKYRPLDVAQQAADAAVKLTDGKDVMALMAQAKVLKEQGKVEEAKKVLEKAHSITEDEDEKAMLDKMAEEFDAPAEAPEAAVEQEKPEASSKS